MIHGRWIVGLIAAAIAASCYASMPRAVRTLAVSPPLRPPVRGAIHIHTRRSDGTGTVDDVARAASRAGLKFVILTDHGDGTREPDTPTYRNGVLCIDAVEISTASGHVVALGLPHTPYSLGGETRDVVEDIARLGGMAIAAHPFSSKPQLRWTDWSLPVHGLEWVNADSEWRDEPLLTIARSLLTYPFRKPETLATLLDRPKESLHHWDELTALRPVVAVAGADAHARIPLTSVGDPYDNRISLPLPGYEQIFRTFSIALPDVTLTGDPRADASGVLDAIRHGRVFSSIDALAGPVAFSFSASGAGDRFAMGEDVIAKGPVTFQVRSNAPDDATVTLLRDGRRVHSVSGAQLEHTSSDRGVYRVELQWPGAPGEPPIPWMVSNPIYVLDGPRGADQISERIAPPTQVDVRYSNGPATEWHIENSPRSRGALDVIPSVGGTQLLLRYALGGTQIESPFVALSMAVPQGLANYDRLIFTAQSSRPARIWVQLRVPGGSQGRSWHRSVYVDEIPRAIAVAFDDFRPLEATTTGRPVLADVRDVLFVIDTIHTRPGVNGQLWLDDVKVGR
ncbi:MAG TPA: CehA/McbA family metallohydrolase [Vicinamibacterales bacterium]|nr:CehA/McbA family metallohydrolase [Vicinamibacterales bacterium]